MPTGLRERGVEGRRIAFCYIEGEVAVGVIGIYGYAGWTLHIRWGGGLTNEKFAYWNEAGSVLLYCWFLSGYALGALLAL